MPFYIQATHPTKSGDTLFAQNPVNFGYHRESLTGRWSQVSRYYTSHAELAQTFDIVSAAAMVYSSIQQGYTPSVSYRLPDFQPILKKVKTLVGLKSTPNN